MYDISSLYLMIQVTCWESHTLTKAMTCSEEKYLPLKKVLPKDAWKLISEQNAKVGSNVYNHVLKKKS